MARIRMTFSMMVVALLMTGPLACKAEPAPSGAATSEPTGGQKEAGGEPSPESTTTPPTSTAQADDAAAPAAPAADDALASFHRTIPEAGLRNDGSCLGENTAPCSDTPARQVPSCAAGAADGAISLEDALNKRNQLVDQQVVIRDRLTVGPVSCTEMACANQCCNKCGASVLLSLPKGTTGYHSLSFGEPFVGIEDGWSCKGDESGVCCGTALPQGEVIVKGTLKSGNSTFWLADVEVCAL